MTKYSILVILLIGMAILGTGKSEGAKVIGTLPEYSKMISMVMNESRGKKKQQINEKITDVRKHIAAYDEVITHAKRCLTYLAYLKNNYLFIDGTLETPVAIDADTVEKNLQRYGNFFVSKRRILCSEKNGLGGAPYIDYAQGDVVQSVIEIMQYAHTNGHKSAFSKELWEGMQALVNDNVNSLVPFDIEKEENTSSQKMAINNVLN